MHLSYVCVLCHHFNQQLRLSPSYRVWRTSKHDLTANTYDATVNIHLVNPCENERIRKYEDPFPSGENRQGEETFVDYDNPNENERTSEENQKLFEQCNKMYESKILTVLQKSCPSKEINVHVVEKRFVGVLVTGIVSVFFVSAAAVGYATYQQHEITSLESEFHQYQLNTSDRLKIAAEIHKELLPIWKSPCPCLL